MYELIEILSEKKKLPTQEFKMSQGFWAVGIVSNSRLWWIWIRVDGEGTSRGLF